MWELRPAAAAPGVARFAVDPLLLARRPLRRLDLFAYLSCVRTAVDIDRSSSDPRLSACSKRAKMSSSRSLGTSFESPSPRRVLTGPDLMSTISNPTVSMRERTVTSSVRSSTVHLVDDLSISRRPDGRQDRAAMRAHRAGPEAWHAPVGDCEPAARNKAHHLIISSRTTAWWSTPDAMPWPRLSAPPDQRGKSAPQHGLDLLKKLRSALPSGCCGPRTGTDFRRRCSSCLRICSSHDRPPSTAP